MILLVHEKGRRVVEVSNGSEKIDYSGDLCQTFWQLAEEFPGEIIVWVEKDLYPHLRREGLKELFDRNLLMVSYAVKTKFLSGEIGYIDQLPFINVKSGVKYPTWRMSTDVGGIKGRTLLKFRSLFGNISDFDYLLNSVAKIGQQNGLFCYSNPQLIQAVRQEDLRSTAGNKELFSFVYQHYKTIWVFVLFFCLAKYEKKFPLGSLFRSFSNSKHFKKRIDLAEAEERFPRCTEDFPKSIDVIIPTLGRTEYVEQVVEDLRQQSILPERVIIVEQNPNPVSQSILCDFLGKEWPFEIIHLFTHETGACMARNKALEKTKADYVFFSDDDQRINKDFLEVALGQMNNFGLACITTSYLQVGESKKFHVLKQWGTFGAGNSIVSRKFASKIRFDEHFEYGYGEDVDYGMKLREAGCDIIYHPHLEIKHLKAPIGGFRKKPVRDWEKEDPQPKPSPTVMLLAKRYYTRRQTRGFKISLYLKFYGKQEEKNPFTYFRKMEEGWTKSEEWAERLEAQTTVVQHKDD